LGEKSQNFVAKFLPLLSRKKESIRFYVLSNPYRSVIAKRVIHLESPSLCRSLNSKQKVFKDGKTDLLICCCSVSQSVFPPFLPFLLMPQSENNARERLKPLFEHILNYLRDYERSRRGIKDLLKAFEATDYS
jgi:hypothetical protein